MSSLSYKLAPDKSGLDVLEHLLINKGTVSRGVHHTLDCGGDGDLHFGPQGILRGDSFIVDAYLFYRYDDGHDLAYVMCFSGKGAISIITNRAFDGAQRLLSAGFAGEIRDFAEEVTTYREDHPYNGSFKFREFSSELIGKLLKAKKFE
ncbi:hypothetical protein [Hadaka virus 1]|uniref:Uncharacterized protein n=1 Tax=Hadaka virus 1 TaxID=2703488 RepID=A0A6J4BJP3_9VIRU|nr:hypothetical protein QK729_s10gp1 [Hadaka virus 1]BBU94047.1 hypothetical protein [Hadaka virus 1]